MSSTTVWIITAMLWYQGPGDYGYTDYEAKQFQGRGECLDYIWDNKADLVEELFRIHGIHEDGRKLKTWGFYCMSKTVNTDEV
jgi:hypothetical protein